MAPVSDRLRRAEIHRSTPHIHGIQALAQIELECNAPFPSLRMADRPPVPRSSAVPPQRRDGTSGLWKPTNLGYTRRCHPGLSGSPRRPGPDRRRAAGRGEFEAICEVHRAVAADLPDQGDQPARRPRPWSVPEFRNLRSGPWRCRTGATLTAEVWPGLARPWFPRPPCPGCPSHPTPSRNPRPGQPMVFPRIVSATVSGLAVPRFREPLGFRSGAAVGHTRARRACFVRFTFVPGSCRTRTCAGGVGAWCWTRWDRMSDTRVRRAFRRPYPRPGRSGLGQPPPRPGPLSRPAYDTQISPGIGFHPLCRAGHGHRTVDPFAAGETGQPGPSPGHPRPGDVSQPRAGGSARSSACATRSAARGCPAATRRSGADLPGGQDARAGQPARDRGVDAEPCGRLRE